jgi:predicted Rossmann fold nucleotide-binding protein DprA/Smf involved in DNA uptake
MQRKAGPIVTRPAQEALWLALLTDPRVDRMQAKAALYRWAIEEQRQTQELASLDAGALRELLPELDEQQALAWQAALGRSEESERVLASWREQGVALITRADAAYPENWVDRLAERWLPYVLFYRGNLELLASPAVSVTGAESPTDAGSAMAEGIGARLGPSAHVLLGGYGQGVDRLALTSGSQALGRTILVLPLGFAHATPILRAGQTAIDQGRRIELSPYEPDAVYTPALGRARSLLVTALAEALVLVEPDTGPDGWLGHEAMSADGGLALIWDQSDADIRQAWQHAGAQPFDSADMVERLIASHLLPQSEEISLDEEGTADDPSAEPVQFDDADTAIRRLGETGRVPDKLARRLRDAEERGLLGDEGERQS